MALGATHGCKVTACLLILLFAGQEVAAFRSQSHTLHRNIKRVDAGLSAENHEAVKTGTVTESSQLWSKLKHAASSANVTLRCGTSTQEMLEAAYLTITSTMGEMATTCEQANSGNQGKCMFRGRGSSPTGLIKKAFRFHSVIGQLVDCPWIEKFGAKQKSTNEALSLDLDRILKNAPELDAYRKAQPKVDFAAFAHSMTKMERDDISTEELQAGTLDASTHIFGTTSLNRAFEEYDEGKIDDVTNVEPAKDVDDLVEHLEPEYCYRKWRWFSANGGCSRGGNFGSESCFMFGAGSYDSEKTKHESEHPHNSVNPSDDIVLKPATDPSQRSAGGFKKSSSSTWGICLPKANPKSTLDRINAIRAKVLKKEELPFSSNTTDSSLIQRGNAHMVSSTQIIGLLVQIPAAILAWVLQMVATLVFLPLLFVAFTSALFLSVLKVFGVIGGIIGFLITLPICVVSVILAQIFSLAYILIDVVYIVAGFIGLPGTLNAGGNKTAALQVLGIANCLPSLALLGMGANSTSSK